MNNKLIKCDVSFFVTSQLLFIIRIKMLVNYCNKNIKNKKGSFAKNWVQVILQQLSQKV